jgi:hypothetical protein
MFHQHVRCFIGRKSVGSLGAGAFDSLYAQLRRCRDLCDRAASAADPGQIGSFRRAVRAFLLSRFL